MTNVWVTSFIVVKFSVIVQFSSLHPSGSEYYTNRYYVKNDDNEKYLVYKTYTNKMHIIYLRTCIIMLIQYTIVCTLYMRDCLGQ